MPLERYAEVLALVSVNGTSYSNRIFSEVTKSTKSTKSVALLHRLGPWDKMRDAHREKVPGRWRWWEARGQVQEAGPAGGQATCRGNRQMPEKSLTMELNF